MSKTHLRRKNAEASTHLLSAFLSRDAAFHTGFRCVISGDNSQVRKPPLLISLASPTTGADLAKDSGT